MIGRKENKGKKCRKKPKGPCLRVRAATTDREEQKFGDGNRFEALDHVLIYLVSLTEFDIEFVRSGKGLKPGGSHNKI
jgi:hypothetical protein